MSRSSESRMPYEEHESNKRRKLLLTSSVATIDGNSQKQISRRSQYLSLDAYSRHKKLVNEYILSHSGSTSRLTRDKSKDKSEYEVLRQNHRFLWDDDDETDTWEKRIAKKYYDRLFKEYCISDLSRYEENKVGLRWRSEEEVVAGKGQFVCGDKWCARDEALKSWEVNFAYHELGQRKNALVKLRLCDQCSPKLNYRHQRKEVKPKKAKTNRQIPSSSDLKTQMSPELVKQNSNLNQVCDSNDNNVANNDSQIWSQSTNLPEIDKPIDDEFDDYLTELLL